VHRIGQIFHYTLFGFSYFPACEKYVPGKKDVLLEIDRYN
jgi:hypothetical protein